jgi:phage-related protein
MVQDSERPLFWISSSKKDLMALPVLVRKFFGHALHFAQNGERHNAAKVLKGFGNAGVLEVVEDDADGTYRAVYTIRFQEAVFVLHCFQKKSKSGIGTPQRDLETIRIRLKAAEAVAKEISDGQARS